MNMQNDKSVTQIREGIRGPKKRIQSAFLFSMLGIAALAACICIVLLIWYNVVANRLPDVDHLRERASQFETTRLFDRNGDLLYEIFDPNAGRRDYVTIEDISPFLIAATIATEDKGFFSHPGFDSVAIIRAAFQNISEGETVSGASTITQQLARNLLLSPEERSQKTVSRKIKEIFLAAEITHRYSKEEILELYLNENYYSNFAYGIEAAAQTYFGVSAKYLNFAQAAFLAGLPQAPSYYDVFTNYEAAITRQNTVLLLSYSLSKEVGCIQINEKGNKICVDEVMVDKAVKDIAAYDFHAPSFALKYPHWVNYVRMQLEEAYGAQDLFRMGLSVYTTIDPELQDAAQQIISAQVLELTANNVHNGALVALVPQTGEILAMVGSPDFSSEEDSGQINMAISPRQPGSSIKPLIYAAAFEEGWTPATLIWDVPTDFSPTGKAEDLIYSQPYSPVNYDGKFRGPVLARDALANSYNIPAVKALEFCGIYDNLATKEPDGFIEFAKRLHVDSLDKPDFGLSIALGGGETTLLEMTSAFGVFATNGGYTAPAAIQRIEDKNGNILFEAEPPPLEKVIKAEYAYQITSILSDTKAREPMFGSYSPLNVSFPAAVKTGTTNDYRDNWTIGYTPDIAVGVWIGNADYTPMINTSGVSGAAPAWNSFINVAVPKLTQGVIHDFVVPSGIIALPICLDSGNEATLSCKQVRNEYFAYYQPPAQSDGLIQKTQINTWNGLKANQYCSEYTADFPTINIQDVWAQRWMTGTLEGQNWIRKAGILTDTREKLFFTPEKECAEGTLLPEIIFTNLSDGMEIKADSMPIFAVIRVPEKFASYSLEFGKGMAPTEWFIIRNGIKNQSYFQEQIASWDLSSLENGVYTVRVYVESTDGTYAEKRVGVRLNKEQKMDFTFDTNLSEIFQLPIIQPTDQMNIPEFFQ